MPAGFQYMAVASSATPIKAPPIAMARLPGPVAFRFKFWAMPVYDKKTNSAELRYLLSMNPITEKPIVAFVVNVFFVYLRF
jgi:hypothetical protein